MAKQCILREGEAKDKKSYDNIDDRQSETMFIDHNGSTVAYFTGGDRLNGDRRYVVVHGIKVSEPYHHFRARCINVEPITDPEVRMQVTEKLGIYGHVSFWD